MPTDTATKQFKSFTLWYYIVGLVLAWSFFILALFFWNLKKEKNCLLARMSGSGTTCFGLFAKKEELNQAFENLKQKFGDDILLYIRGACI